MGGLPHRSPLSSYWPLLRTEPLSAFSFFTPPLAPSLPSPSPLRNSGNWIHRHHQWFRKKKKKLLCHTGSYWNQEHPGSLQSRGPCVSSRID